MLTRHSSKVQWMLFQLSYDVIYANDKVSDEVMDFGHT